MSSTLPNRATLRASLWCYLLTLLTGWLLYSTNYDAALYLRGVLQFFAGGVSFWKGTFFFAWATFVIVVLLLSRCITTTFSRRELVLATILPALLNFTAHLIFTGQFRLGLFERVIAVSNGLISSNVFCHTHVLKSALATLITSTPLSSFSFHGDSGIPFLHLVAAPLRYGALIMVVLAGYVFARTAVVLRNRSPGRQLHAWLPLYLITSYAVLRSFIDGGIFSAEYVALAPLLLFTILKRVPQPPPRFIPSFWR